MSGLSRVACIDIREVEKIAPARETNLCPRPYIFISSISIEFEILVRL